MTLCTFGGTQRCTVYTTSASKLNAFFGGAKGENKQLTNTGARNSKTPQTTTVRFRTSILSDSPTEDWTGEDWEHQHPISTNQQVSQTALQTQLGRCWGFAFTGPEANKKFVAYDSLRMLNWCRAWMFSKQVFYHLLFADVFGVLLGTLSKQYLSTKSLESESELVVLAVESELISPWCKQHCSIWQHPIGWPLHLLVKRPK